MSTFLDQLRSGIGSLLGKDVGTLSEAELAQLVTDEAEKAPKPTEAVVEAVVETATEPTPDAINADAADNSALMGRLASAEATIESLQGLVNAQTEAVNAQAGIVKDLTSKVETLKSLNTVLTNKVVSLNVGSVTTPSADKDVITEAVKKAENDDNVVVNMNMSDFMGISKPKNK
ncbi:MAG: hypothetical protein KA234_00390 [Saprospiraceae bacterium]|nr:hypothetical protein [Saprospiraceae bacterium]